MNRLDFQRLAAQRRREAAALLSAGQYPGAYYLVGYAVECALKSCIAKRTRRYEFPSRNAAEAYTHNLEKLLQLAKVDADLDRDKKASSALEVNWSVVKDWSEASRYDLSITQAQARDLYSACTARSAGILAWIRMRW